jgi:hypothetical protein
MLIIEPKYYTEEIIPPIIGKKVYDPISGSIGTVIKIKIDVDSGPDTLVAIAFAPKKRSTFYTTGVYIFSLFKIFSVEEFEYTGVQFWKQYIFERDISYIRLLKC